MSDSPMLKKVQELLNEEKWTRTALHAYSVNNFTDLDKLLREIEQEKCIDEIKILCDEHLVHTKSSIIASYIRGVISLLRQELDDSHMSMLLNLFSDSKKWGLVEFICNKSLSYGENRSALRYLSLCYEAESKYEEMYLVWERLVSIDFEEADKARDLAVHFEKKAKIPEAVDFYKKALHRYINKGLAGSIKEIWSKLVELCPKDIDFFIFIQRKIAKQISEDKAANLLQELYRYYKSQNDWTTGLDILKIIINYDEKSSSIRKEIVDCLREKYKGHTHLEDCIRLSNITASYRSIHDAMDDFEKHIAFDVGNFVYHRTWNIGKISGIRGDEIQIDFAKQRGHKMALKMAISSLESLSKEHIWVLKALQSKEKIRERVKSDIVWALKIIIKSFDNCADIKKIKSELVPSILTPSEWNNWSLKARETLKTNSDFGNAADSITTYLVRDRPLSYEEKMYNQFKAEKGYFSRVGIIREWLESSDLNSEYFKEMIDYFAGFLKSVATINEYTISSFLLIKELAMKNPRLKSYASMEFSDLYKKTEDPASIYQVMKDAHLRRSFLLHIRNFATDWSSAFIKIFPISLNMQILETLTTEGYTKELKTMVAYIFDNYKDYREALIWLVKNVSKEPWYKELNISEEKTNLVLIHLLDVTFKEIESHRDTLLNRKINKQIQTMLFKNSNLENYLLDATTESIERIYTFIMDVGLLDPAIKLSLRQKIVEKHPNFKFTGETEKHFVSRGLIVTASKYEEKQRVLQHLLEVEVPANQKEIAYALSLGDLRENAEYKSAKEKQDELNSRVGKLKNEIERAQLFDKSNISINKISFGTVALLKNELTNESETYTILGPWESDPQNNIISYLSPLGKHLLNHKPGEELSFLIHERKFQYKVEKIEAAQF